jgi:hypothetical protein
VEIGAKVSENMVDEISKFKKVFFLVQKIPKEEIRARCQRTW